MACIYGIVVDETEADILARHIIPGFTIRVKLKPGKGSGGASRQETHTTSFDEWRAAAEQPDAKGRLDFALAVLNKVLRDLPVKESDRLMSPKERHKLSRKRQQLLVDRDALLVMRRRLRTAMQAVSPPLPDKGKMLADGVEGIITISRAG